MQRINSKNIKKIIAKLKKNKRKIGLVHGVFDVLHAGHLLYFEEAKKNVDFLIASVTSDKYAMKAPGKPIFGIENRSKVLQSLKSIDYVIESNSPTAVNVINDIKPSIYFKGKDYLKTKDLSGNLKKEIAAIKKIKGKFLITNSKLYSSSRIINEKFDYLNKDAKNFLNKYDKKNLRNKIELFQNLNKKILVIGDPILDIYKMVSPSGKSNKANVLSTRILSEKLYAGGSLLVSNILKNFSKNITYLTISNKKNKKYFNKLLNHKIKKALINSNIGLIEKVRYLDDYYLNKLFQVTQNEDLELNNKSKKNILNYVRKNFQKFDKIFVFDYGYFTVFKDLLKLFNNNKSIQKKLIINCQSNSYNFGFNLANKYKSGEIMAMDEIEFRLCCKDRKTEMQKLIKQNIHLFNKFKILIVTQGKNGSYIILGKKVYYVPTVFKFAKDTIGCGDVFLAIFGLAYISKLFNLVDVALISHMAAGIHANYQGNENYITNKKLIETVKNIIKK
tara:strand:- start:152 stop:1663 length:1512 start_codon:yes stop_codon:yes gene_type:complete